MDGCISIIVPVYNVEKYLRRCIDSIINQTYTKLEILLIDDGSKDQSLNICQEYEKQDARIRVFHKKNEGLGLTRNYGLARVTGEFVTFVDSDDYIVSDALEKLYQKAKETQADVVVANSFYKDVPQKVYLPEKLYCGNEIKDILMVHMMGNAPDVLDGLSYTAWGKLYRRSLFCDNGLVFPSERKMIWEDLVFNTDAFPACERIYVSHFPMYYYCFNEGSLTHTYKPNKLNMVMYLHKYMTGKIKELNLPSDAQHRLDNNFIGHIRTCIKLEVYYASINGRKQAMSDIRDICNNKDVQMLVKEYSKSDFNNAQRIYNFFLENKLVCGVYFLTWMQNKKKRIE